MLELKYGDSVTSQQQAWHKEALSRMTFAKDLKTVKFTGTVHTVDDPPCPGHGDYMCTVVSDWDDGTHTVDFYIRSGADDASQAFNAGVADDVKKFFMESSVHEYGHAIMGLWMATTDDERDEICSWFRYADTGRAGGHDDWSPADGAWEDLIQEAVVEFFKDVYMPPEYRYFQQRTNWSFDKAYFSTFLDRIEAFLCVDDGSGAG